MFDLVKTDVLLAGFVKDWGNLIKTGLLVLE